MWSTPCPKIICLFLSAAKASPILFGFLKSNGDKLTDSISPVGIKVLSVGKNQLAFTVKIWSSIEGQGSTNPNKLINIWWVILTIVFLSVFPL